MAVLVLLAAVLGAAGAVLGAPVASGAALSAPTFAWSNQPYLLRAQQQHQQQQHAAPQQGHGRSVSYQVHEDLAELLKALVGSCRRPGGEGFLGEWLDAAALQQRAPELVLVVLGSQLRTSDLASTARRGALQPLRDLLDEAESSLSVPYMMHQVASPLEGRRLQQLAADVGAATVIGCGDGEEQERAALAGALEQLSGGGEPRVVVMCTHVGAEESGTAAGLEAELLQLQDAHARVAALGRPQLTVYAARPDAAGLLAQRRRRLQQANADVGTCGQLCQTQVKWLEGILATFILAIAAISGLCCLYMLDTPTRFEKPKEGVRND